MFEPGVKRFNKDEADKEDVKEAEPEALIHNLPPELLILIFTNLSSRDLLNSVAKVCRRWRETLHCKALWENMELSYQPRREWAFLFVLGATPALKKIALTPLACDNPQLVVSAILNGPTNVRALHFNSSLFNFSTAARILRHYQDYLEELHLEGDKGRQTSLQRNLSPMLARMSKLKVLKLSGYFDGKWDMNVLQQGCSNLVHLDVSQIEDESDSYLPLLESLKLRLRVLRLPQFKSNVGVLALASCCTSITDITLSLDEVRCIRNMHNLKSLHVEWIEAPHIRVMQFIRECPVFENLTELTLHYIPSVPALAIAKRCCRLEHLTMNGIMACPSIIKVLPTLKRLCIIDRLMFRMRHLQKIPYYMPCLQYLDVRGCFKQRGIPPKIEAHLKNALPGLSLLSDPFLFYSKHDKGGFPKSKGREDSSTDCSSEEA